MKKIIFFILISFIFSCKQKNKNESELNDNLYTVLIEYQKKNPFKETPENSIYVYEVYFYQDSPVSVTLNAIGVNREEKNLYGIYKDETLKATYIVDNSRIGKNFVKKYFQKTWKNLLKKIL